MGICYFHNLKSNKAEKKINNVTKRSGQADLRQMKGTEACAQPSLLDGSTGQLVRAAQLRDGGSFPHEHLFSSIPGLHGLSTERNQGLTQCLLLKRQLSYSKAHEIEAWGSSFHTVRAGEEKAIQRKVNGSAQLGHASL